MSDQPHSDRDETAAERNEEGIGLGMSEEDNTFEPEEDPAAVDEPDGDTGAPQDDDPAHRL